MNTSYTPALMVQENIHFSIPLYQRLFEWDVENIEVLLDDLYRAYTVAPDEEYHIGLLTTTFEKDLVDGQQRFTVLMLLGCILRNYDSRWNDFVAVDNPRLNFQSRPNDMAYIKRVISEGLYDFQDEYTNGKMQSALNTIEVYVAKIESPDDKRGFSSFCYEHIRFFVTVLPQQYSPKDLNKYFERMNSTGKDLEQHEILKVKLLKNLDGNVSALMKLWNKIAEVDMELLRIRRHKNETEQEFANRRESVLRSDLDVIISNGLVNGISLSDKMDYGLSKSIREIEPSDIAPKRVAGMIRETKSLFTFPMIILLTLYWKLTDEKKRIESLHDFFNPANLLETFASYLPYEGSNVDKAGINDFIIRLLRVRAALDFFFVRSNKDGYSLEMASEDSEDGNILLMFESMLFVSSNRYSYYKWFYALMNYISTCDTLPTENELYKLLKDNDDASNELPPYQSLSYGNGDAIRYWFWRLDFYLWKNRKSIFNDNSVAMQIAEKYRFARNRSIEHVAPQHPVQNSSLQWEETDGDEALRDSFGNLVMISGGLNSSLKNQPYEVKKAHVRAYINGSLNGSIESLSLLLLNEVYKTWNRETIAEYGKLTYHYLQESYNDALK